MELAVVDIIIIIALLCWSRSSSSSSDADIIFGEPPVPAVVPCKHTYLFRNQ
jgi:hypothetical protein